MANTSCYLGYMDSRQEIEEAREEHSNSDLPPDIVFHRFFQRDDLAPIVRYGYRGKQDLARLNPQRQLLLSQIQNSLNEALRNEKEVPEHVEHGPFHLDYIDSDIPNALAFAYGGYSFIGVTTALIDKLWQSCERLGNVRGLREQLDVRLPTSNEADAFGVLLFQTQFNFIVAHEYTHHVHGHVLSRPLDFQEILSDDEIGTLEQQAFELDADGYAAYHVLANLIDAEERPPALRVLKLYDESLRVQNNFLLSCFIVSVGGYLLTSRPAVVDGARIYTLTHPPQAARLNSIMLNAMSWSKQNRPDLQEAMTLDRFRALMGVAAEATWGMNGEINWNAQTAFLQSPEGVAYFNSLDDRLKVHMQSLGIRA